MELQSKLTVPVIHPFAITILEDLKNRIIHTLDEYPIEGCLSMQLQIDQLIKDISYFIKTNPEGEFKVFIYEDETSWKRNIASVGFIIWNYAEKPDEDRHFEIRILPNWSSFTVVQISDGGLQIPIKRIKK